MVNEISISKRGFHSKFRSHKVLEILFEISLPLAKFRLIFRSHLRNLVRNFALTNEISNEFCHLQRICQVKFRTSARNFVNGETIEAREISPKIRSPRNFADLRRIS